MPMMCCVANDEWLGNKDVVCFSVMS